MSIIFLYCITLTIIELTQKKNLLGVKDKVLNYILTKHTTVNGKTIVGNLLNELCVCEFCATQIYMTIFAFTLLPNFSMFLWCLALGTLFSILTSYLYKLIK